MKKIAVAVVVTFLSFAVLLPAQSLGTLKGVLSDESGAVIPGATVTAAGPAGVAKTATSQADGSYSFTGLAPGEWTVQATSPGLTQFQPAKVTINGGAVATLNIQLRVEAQKQEVTVQEEGNNQVSTDPSSNASSIVLKGEDLDALSDDPDDLQQDLQALAGPSAGPDGGQIYIDGFTGGQLPPKSSIREIRINQNPFSAEYDKLGFGRIQIFTKPGTDTFHGEARFTISDGMFNSRNPFLLTGQTPSFQTRWYGGNLGGALSKKASFFVDFDRRAIDDQSIINTDILNTSLQDVRYSAAVFSPQTRTSFSPRIDYALTPNNTLTARYRFVESDFTNNGLSASTLPGRAYNTSLQSHTGQLTETAVIHSSIINETRFEFQNEDSVQNGNTLPVVSVGGAFSTGGSGVGVSSSLTRYWEIQNYTSFVKGPHSVKFGVRIRGEELNDVAMSNFGGTFMFTSLEQYRQTLLGQAVPSQFSISTGNPLASISQVDFGPFIQDDWRVKPNFTLSLGLRYETQTNIHDWTDFAPRVGFAWAPGQGGKGSTRAKTVIRGGSGIFYSRVTDSLSLQALRYNGLNQQSIRVFNPTFFLDACTVDNPTAPTCSVPALDQLPAPTQSQIRWQVDPNIRAPYIIQSAIGVERQLGKNTSVTVNFTNSRGVHLLMARDINAPLPGTFDPITRAGGVRPYGNVGDIYQYESAGILNQNQLMTNFNTRVGSWFSLFGFYSFNHARSNTDGASSFPANDYDLSDEYGRAQYDIRHRVFLGGSIMAKWGIRLSPFMMAHSGAPFDVTTGLDTNGDALYNERPALVAAGTPGSIMTPYGAFVLNPAPGQQVIPRNFLEGPSFFEMNLRVSKTWGFGPEKSGGSGFNGGGRGGRGGGFGGRGGFHSIFGPVSTGRKYNVTLSVNARNLFNDTNFGAPIGNLSSPLFGTSTSLAGGFGPSRTAANNRRIDFQLRFAF